MCLKGWYTKLKVLLDSACSSNYQSFINNFFIICFSQSILKLQLAFMDPDLVFVNHDLELHELWGHGLGLGRHDLCHGNKQRLYSGTQKVKHPNSLCASNLHVKEKAK